MKREVNRGIYFEEVVELEKQIITFPVIVKDGVVTCIGNSYTSHPEIRFNGKSIKWYEDKKKDKSARK